VGDGGGRLVRRRRQAEDGALEEVVEAILRIVIGVRAVAADGRDGRCDGGVIVEAGVGAGEGRRAAVVLLDLGERRQAEALPRRAARERRGLGRDVEVEGGRVVLVE